MEPAIYVILLIFVNILIWMILSMAPRIKNKKKVFIILSFATILLFLTISKPYSDMVVYEKYFQSLNFSRFESINNKDWEILFRLLLYFIRFFTDNPQIMRIIIAFLTLIGPFMFIKKYSKNYLLTIIMFIALGSFYMNFYILRQAIAISIFLFAFQFITDRKLIKYCLSIVIAALFHKTAIILLVLYPLVNIPPSKWKKIITTTIVVVGLVASVPLSSFLAANLYHEYSGNASGKGIVLLLFYLFMYGTYMFLVKEIRKKEKTEIIKATYFTMFWQFFATQNSAFNRLANYTRDSFCILIPNSIMKLERRKRIFCSAMVVVVCIAFIMATGAFSWYNIM